MVALLLGMAWSGSARAQDIAETAGPLLFTPTLAASSTNDEVLTIGSIAQVGELQLVVRHEQQVWNTGIEPASVLDILSVAPGETVNFDVQGDHFVAGPAGGRHYVNTSTSRVSHLILRSAREASFSVDLISLQAIRSSTWEDPADETVLARRLGAGPASDVIGRARDIAVASGVPYAAWHVAPQTLPNPWGGLAVKVDAYVVGTDLVRGPDFLRVVQAGVDSSAAIDPSAERLEAARLSEEEARTRVLAARADLYKLGTRITENGDPGEAARFSRVARALRVHATSDERADMQDLEGDDVAAPAPTPAPAPPPGPVAAPAQPAAPAQTVPSAPVAAADAVAAPTARELSAAADAPPPEAPAP